MSVRWVTAFTVRDEYFEMFEDLGDVDGQIGGGTGPTFDQDESLHDLGVEDREYYAIQMLRADLQVW